MELAGRVVLVTGGAKGIGRALCLRIAQENPKGIIVADLDFEAACEAANSINGLAVSCDVADESDVQAAVEKAQQAFGPIDVVISNAGVTAKGGFETPDSEWSRLWQINVMAHVYLARAVLPSMTERGQGAFVITASAAGLLTEIGSAAYSVTKHGAVAFAEWLSVHYRNNGLKVACLCPAGVATDFLDTEDPVHQFLQFRSVTAEHVAESLVEALRNETFLVLPHPEISEFFKFKTENYDRWLHNFAHVNGRIQKQQKRASERAKESPDVK